MPRSHWLQKSLVRSFFLTNLGSCDGTLKGRLLNVQTITSSGSYSKTPGANFAIVEVVGPGGGGQEAGSTKIVGGGGGAGAYVKALISSLPVSYSIIIGSAGTGTTASVSGVASNPGGVTTFDSLITCNGGGGGISQQPVSGVISCLAPGGLGGAYSSTGVILINASNGAPGAYGTGIDPNYLGGNGGNTPLGNGGFGTASVGTIPATNGSGYGPGGGGNASITTAAHGGNGASGVVIIWEYA